MITLIPTLEIIALFIATLAVLGAAAMYGQLRSHTDQLNKVRRILADELNTREQLQADFHLQHNNHQQPGRGIDHVGPPQPPRCLQTLGIDKNVEV